MTHHLIMKNAIISYDIIVIVFFYLSLFFSFAEHDNALDFLFPDHPPEVIDSVWEGTLSGNVGSFLPVALCKK